MSAASNRPEGDAAALCHRYVEEFLDTGDASVAEDLLDERVVAHQLGVERDLLGRDAVVEQRLAFRNAVPDWTLVVEDVAADGDTVMLRLTARGTPEHAWGKLVPTGKSFEAAAFFAFRVEGGRIVEQWNPVNLAGVGRQLGLMPPTPRVLVAMARHRLSRRLDRRPSTG